MTDQHLAIPYHIAIFDSQHVPLLAVPHTMHDRCLVLVLAGNTTITCQQNEQTLCFAVHAKDAFVIPAHALVEIAHHPNLHLAVIWYHNSRINSFVGSFKQMSSYQALFSIYPALGLYQFPSRRLQMGDALLAKIHALVQDIAQEYAEKSSGFQQVVNSSFFIIITLMSRHFSIQQTTATGIAIQMAQAAAYMEDHCGEEITIPQLSRMANISDRHFNRCFHQVYQTTPLQYLQIVRLQRACALLNEDYLSITEVANECGFGDSNYFSRIFKQHFAQSPTEYRKKFK